MYGKVCSKPLQHALGVRCQYYSCIVKLGPTLTRQGPNDWGQWSRGIPSKSESMATHGIIFYTSGSSCCKRFSGEVILGSDLGEAFDELLLNHISDSKQEQAMKEVAEKKKEEEIEIGENEILDGIDTSGEET